MNIAEKIDGGFTPRKKGFFALGTIGLIILWMILWYVFPMEWYSFFFASTVGSYIHLVLLATVLIFPMCWLLTVITGRNISIVKNYPVSLVFMIAIVFLFSAFRYDMAFLPVTAGILHAIAMVWVIGTAKHYERRKIKRIKNAEAKKQPLLVVLSAVLYTAAINSANIFLFYKIAHIYVDYSY